MAVAVLASAGGAAATVMAATGLYLATQGRAQQRPLHHAPTQANPGTDANPPDTIAPAPPPPSRALAPAVIGEQITYETIDRNIQRSPSRALAPAVIGEQITYETIDRNIQRWSTEIEKQALQRLFSRDNYRVVNVLLSQNLTDANNSGNAFSSTRDYLNTLMEESDLLGRVDGRR